MKHRIKLICAALSLLFLLTALASCSEKEAAFDINAISGVWAYEAEDLYFVFDSSNSSWKMIDANEGIAAEGEFSTEPGKISLHSDGQLYLDLTVTNNNGDPLSTVVFEFDGGMLGYMFDLDAKEAKDLLSMPKIGG